MALATQIRTVELRDPVISVLAYYDIFRYPLTGNEIHTFLSVPTNSPEETMDSLRALSDQGEIQQCNGYYFLPHRDQSIASRRASMEQQGTLMWNKARFMARLMSKTPYVRGLFISGQLCRYIADEESDIDYFIITEPGRLWIVRFLFVLFRRTILLNKRKYFCTNYYVTTDNLEILERNTYVACEVASTKPMYNRELFRNFMRANSWIHEYYPNFSLEQIELRQGIEGNSVFKRVVERLIPQSLAERTDKKLMELTRKYWRRKFPEIAGEKPLNSQRDESRAHPNDQSELVMSAYRKTLERYGLST